MSPPAGRLLILPRLHWAPGKVWAPVSQVHPSLPSEGSVIAYYWSEFDIPKHLVKEAEQAMAEKRMVTVPPRARSMSSFVMTSVVAFRECRGHRGWALVRPGARPAPGLVWGPQLSRSQCLGEETASWPGTSL